MNSILRTQRWSAANQGYDQVTALAQAWLETPALAKVTASFDGPKPSAVSIAQLAQWSAATLDHRPSMAGPRRPHTPLTDTQNQALLNAADKLGLLATPTPRQSSYDTVVILGGAAREHASRSAFAASLVADLTTHPTVVALATDRRLRTTERFVPPHTTQPAHSEWESLAAAVDASFGPLRLIGEVRTPLVEELHVDRTYYSALGAVRILCAPAIMPYNRSDTPTTLQYLLDCLSAPALRNVLIVTSAITAPHTFFTAAPALLAASGDQPANVEVVGTGAYSTTAPLLAGKVAYEINHTITAIARFYALTPTPAPLPAPTSQFSRLSS